MSENVNLSLNPLKPIATSLIFGVGLGILGRTGKMGAFSVTIPSALLSSGISISAALCGQSLAGAVNKKVEFVDAEGEVIKGKEKKALMCRVSIIALSVMVAHCITGVALSRLGGRVKALQLNVPSTLLLGGVNSAVALFLGKGPVKKAQNSGFKAPAESEEALQALQSKIFELQTALSTRDEALYGEIRSLLGNLVSYMQKLKGQGADLSEAKAFFDAQVGQLCDESSGLAKPLSEETREALSKAIADCKEEKWYTGAED